MWEIRLKHCGLRFGGFGGDSVNQGVAGGFFFFFPSVCLAKQADKFAGFQPAGCMLKSAGAEWKVNVSYHMNLSGNILQFSSTLTANVLFFFFFTFG